MKSFTLLFGLSYAVLSTAQITATYLHLSLHDAVGPTSTSVSPSIAPIARPWSTSGQTTIFSLGCPTETSTSPDDQAQATSQPRGTCDWSTVSNIFTQISSTEFQGHWWSTLAFNKLMTLSVGYTCVNSEESLLCTATRTVQSRMISTYPGEVSFSKTETTSLTTITVDSAVLATATEVAFSTGVFFNDVWHGNGGDIWSWPGASPTSTITTGEASSESGEQTRATKSDSASTTKVADDVDSPASTSTSTGDAPERRGTHRAIIVAIVGSAVLMIL